MNDIVHLIKAADDGAGDGTILVQSQITLCCHAWLGDNRVKLATHEPDACTCTGDLTDPAPLDVLAGMILEEDRNA